MRACHRNQSDIRFALSLGEVEIKILGQRYLRFTVMIHGMRQHTHEPTTSLSRHGYIKGLQPSSYPTAPQQKVISHNQMEHKNFQYMAYYLNGQAVLRRL